MQHLQGLIYSIKQSRVQFITEGWDDDPHFPGLCIKDIGEISLPLCELQAESIISKLKESAINTDQEKL